MVLDRALDRHSGIAGDQMAAESSAESEDAAVAMMKARADSRRQMEERIVAAHMAGETSHEIGAREKMSSQKVAAIIRWHKR